MKKRKPDPQRKRLDDIRPSLTHHGRYGENVDYYVTVGFYDGDSNRHCPGEIFISIGLHSDPQNGLVDCWAVSMSLALQYGVPWEHLRSKIPDFFGLYGKIAASIDLLIQERKSIIGYVDPDEDDVACSQGFVDDLVSSARRSTGAVIDGFPGTLPGTNCPLIEAKIHPKTGERIATYSNGKCLVINDQKGINTGFDSISDYEKERGVE
jgi:hypothetical protein